MGLQSQMHVTRLTHTPNQETVFVSPSSCPQALLHESLNLLCFLPTQPLSSFPSPLISFAFSRTRHKWITVRVLLCPAAFTGCVLLVRLVHGAACAGVSSLLLLSRAALCAAVLCNACIRSPVEGHVDVSSFWLLGIMLLWDSGQIVLCQYSFNLHLSLWLRFWDLFKWVRAICISFSINFLFKSWPIFQ